jgi:hypothetical protein
LARRIPDAVVAGLVPATPIAVLTVSTPEGLKPGASSRVAETKPDDDGSM